MGSPEIISVCSLSSGIDDLPPRRRTQINVLRILRDRKRFSVFEATANLTVARIVDELLRSGLVRDVGGAYPWTNVEMSPRALELISEDDARPKQRRRWVT